MGTVLKMRELSLQIRVDVYYAIIRTQTRRFDWSWSGYRRAETHHRRRRYGCLLDGAVAATVVVVGQFSVEGGQLLFARPFLRTFIVAMFERKAFASGVSKRRR